MERLQIGTTDILLEDYGDNSSGKIIIADFDYDYNFSYYWGSMGMDLRSFLGKINVGYFCGKLSNDTGIFDAKGTYGNVRKYIREEMRYDLPWYENMAAQKELRAKLKEMERECYDGSHFVNQMNDLADSLYCEDMDYKEERVFKELINDHLNCEPWHWISTKDSNETNFLAKLLPKIQKQLKKEINLQSV